MKSKILCLFMLMILGSGSIMAQQFKDAVSYLEFINKENNLINNQVWQYTKAVAHDKRPRKIEKTRLLLVKQIQSSRSKIEAITPYDNDQVYKSQFIDFLTIYENVINNDYAKIVDMKEIAEQSYDYMEAYILMQEQVDEKMENALDSINNGMTEYATKYDIKLIAGEESDLTKKMKISNDVFKHKNSVYLPFFKANFQEGELILSLSSNNVGTIQQVASSLSLFAKEGLDSLTIITAYKNDKSLLDITKKVLLFYQEEADVKVPEMIEFFLLTDKVTKMKETIENKKSSDRTKEEIDEYNAMVKKINDAAAKFNKTNEILNKKRTALLTEWENTSNNFLSRHIPKN